MFFYSPGGQQDIPGSETELMVVVHEEIDRLVCREVLDLQDGQGRASAIPQQNRVVDYSSLEMGRDYDAFYHQIASDCVRSGFDMGHRGSVDQECAFCPNLGEHLCRKVGIYIHSGDCGMEWHIGYYGL